MKKLITIVVISLSFIASSGFANERLIAEYKPQLEAIEKYINEIKNATGKFQQYANDGSSISGNFYISRPGKMRLDYDMPVNIQLIAKDGTLVYYDKKLDQTNYIDMSTTPLSLLLGENPSFKKANVDIIDIETNYRQIAITMRPKEKNFSGTATIIFTTDPVGLRKWIVIDAQNIRSEIILDALNHNIDFEPGFFDFKKPEKAKKTKKPKKI